MKKLCTLLAALMLLVLTLSGCTPENLFEEGDAKPVIYLYPEEETEVTVRLDYDGDLTTTYPAYADGWTVTAAPDGTLTGEDGREYYCLFWEGTPSLGLTAREANEFLIYWLPKLEANPYNLLSFQTKGYTDHARLTVSPQPDTVLRVFLAFKALEEPVEIKPQTLTAPAREGFTVVEWGGCQVS